MILKNSNNKTELDTQLQKDPQYRRELSISYFNSLNNAVNLVMGSTTKTTKIEKKLEMIKEIRNQFMEEYKQYRVDVLDSAGKTSVDPKVVPALDKMKKKYEDTSIPTTDGGVV